MIASTNIHKRPETNTSFVTNTQVQMHAANAFGSFVLQDTINITLQY